MVRPSFFVLLSLLAGLLSGCGTAPAASTASSEPPAVKVSGPTADLYGQLHAGLYQVDSAIDSLTTAAARMGRVQSVAGGSAKQGLDDLLTHIRGAGRTMQDMVANPPTAEMVTKQPDEYDDRRLKAIQSANDSLGDLYDAQDILDGLIKGAPPEVDEDLKSIQSSLDDAVDGVESAVHLMGGKLEDEATSSSTKK